MCAESGNGAAAKQQVKVSKYAPQVGAGNAICLGDDLNLHGLRARVLDVIDNLERALGADWKHGHDRGCGLVAQCDMLSLHIAKGWREAIKQQLARGTVQENGRKYNRVSRSSRLS